MKEFNENSYYKTLRVLKREVSDNKIFVLNNMSNYDIIYLLKYNLTTMIRQILCKGAKLC